MIVKQTKGSQIKPIRSVDLPNLTIIFPCPPNPFILLRFKGLHEL
ncbi:MAG: hypothetical protein NZ955_00940 [Candidatus Bathyarchaeota archaeon]|nr:hypothetical protein [Candidatus Bathyarchaeota archaeon]MCX8162115.1 hypothetical protein [Candidatus Bathyarchaeota archaeon]